MITLEEFEDQLVEGITKIENQFLHYMIKPDTLFQMEMKVVCLLDTLGDQLYLDRATIREKVLVKVSSDNYDGVITIDFSNPCEPFYEVRYDGTLGPRVTGYRRYHTTEQLYNALTKRHYVTPKP
jgi:hypothetical protein